MSFKVRTSAILNQVQQLQVEINTIVGKCSEEDFRKKLLVRRKMRRLTQIFKSITANVDPSMFLESKDQALKVRINIGLDRLVRERQRFYESLLKGRLGQPKKSWRKVFSTYETKCIFYFSLTGMDKCLKHGPWFIMSISASTCFGLSLRIIIPFQCCLRGHFGKIGGKSLSLTLISVCFKRNQSGYLMK